MLAVSVRLSILALAMAMVACSPQAENSGAVGPVGEGVPFVSGQKIVPIEEVRTPKGQNPRIFFVEKQEEKKDQVPAQQSKAPVELPKSAPDKSLPTRFPFQVLQPKFNIDLDRQIMDFEFSVEMNGKQELIRLSGEFDKSSRQWLSYMFPVDAKLRGEKRIQATAMCLEAYLCDHIAVDLYIRVGQQVYRRQFKSQVLKPLTKKIESETTPDFPSEIEEEEPTTEAAADASEDQSNSPEVAQEDQVKEWDDEVILPTPPKTESTIEGLPEISFSTAYRAQAIGSHNRGYLQNASLFPDRGHGFINRAVLRGIPESKRASYGTELMKDLLVGALAQVEQRFPDRPKLVVGDVSAKGGRKLHGHRSHQSGLDVDISFFPKTKFREGFWSALNKRNKLHPEFDLERNWELIKQLHNTDQDHMIVVFVDNNIKQALCRHARKVGDYSNNPKSLSYKALRNLRHWKGHANHFHIRMLCPNTKGCSNTRVQELDGTGCR